MLEITEYENKIEELMVKIVDEYSQMFEKKGIKLRYNGISRHGNFSDNDYSSEIEIAFINKEQFDYLDFYNCLIVLHGKINIETDVFYEETRKELSEIFKNPGKDWKYNS